MQQRFRIVKSFSRVLFIKDNKDDTIVAAVHGFGREERKTEAMAKVMVDALNREVEKYILKSNQFETE